MPKINVKEMPSVDLRNFCRTFSAAIERSAEDPAFLDAYNRHRAGKEVEATQPMVNTVVHIPSTETPTTTVSVKP